MAQAGTATVKFVGDYSQMNAGLASALAPAKLKGIGAKAGLAIGGAIAAAGVAKGLSDAVKVTKEFEKEMSSLGAVADANSKQMDRLRKQAIKMGAATVFSATEAAQAQTELAKGGLDASQILGGALKSSLDLAAAGELELAAAAETTVNAMQLFGMEGRQTSQIADMLATAANKTTADVLDFAMSLKMGGAVAKTAGYSLNDTVVILEALAEAGIKNSDAGTSMKTSLIQLLNPTTKQAKLAEQLGISWLKQNGELKNGIQISKELRKATEGMTKAERTKTFAVLAGTDGFRTLSALYDAGAGKLKAYSRANTEAGTAAEVAAKKTDNLAGDIEGLSGVWETFQLTIGQKVTPILRDLTQAATEAVNKVTAIFDDKNLSGGEKFSKLVELGVKGLAKGFEELLKQAVRAAPEVAAAFAEGFASAPIWMQLAGAGLILKMFGGTAGVVSAGTRVGAIFMGAFESVTQTYSLARSFGRGKGASAFAGIGSLALPMATSLFSTLARVIPGVAAAYAITDVITTVIGGSLKDALVKIGSVGAGAGIGAVIGSIFPGVGTLIGAAIGAGAGSLLSNLFGGGGKIEKTLRERIRESSKRLANGLKVEVASIANLRQATKGQVEARRNQRRAATQAERAELALNRARRQHGPASERAMRAEARYKIALDKSRKAEDRLRRANRLQGAERRATVRIMRDNVQEAKANIGRLRTERQELRKQRRENLKNNGSLDELREIQKKLRVNSKELKGAQDKVNRTIQRAGQTIGPKFARSLEKISVLTGTASRVMPRLSRATEDAMRKSRSETNRASLKFEALGDVVISTRKTYGRNVGQGIPNATESGMGKVHETLQKYLDEIQNTGIPRQNKRRGGLVNWARQKFQRGGVPVALSPGELYKLPGGQSGIVPGEPTAADNVLTSMPAGTKIFTFDGQRRLAEGASEAEALRNQLPHFARGGIVKPEVTGGTRKSAEVANAAIGKVHSAATRKLKKERKKARDAAREKAANNGGAFVGPPPGMKQLGDNDWVDSHTMQVARFLASRFGASISSSYRSPAHNAAVGGVPGSSHTRGSASNPGAFDFVPPSGAMQAWAGKHIAGIVENMIHDVGSGLHNHIAFFRQGGLLKGLRQMASGGTLHGYQVAQYAHKGGFPRSALQLVTAISKGESNWNPNANYVTSAEDSRGLMQINTYAHKINRNLYDPLVNMQEAKKIRDRAGGYGPWSVYTSGKYQQYMGQAAAAVKTAERLGLGNVDGGGGPSPAERRKAQSKRRREDREKKIKELRKKAKAATSPLARKGALWELVQSYAKWGRFNWVNGKEKDLGEDRYMIEQARKVAGLVNPNQGAGQLAKLSKWLDKRVEIHGEKNENKGLAKRLATAKKNSTKRATKKRKRLFKRISDRGLKYPHLGRLKWNDRVIRSLDEWIELAERKHTSPWSAPYPNGDGSEYTDSEVDYEVRLNKSLRDSLLDHLRLTGQSIQHVTARRNEFRDLVKQASKKGSPLKWKLGAYRKGLAGAKSSLANLISVREELVGVTGKGGRLNDVSMNLLDLGVRETTEKVANQGITIGDLQQIVEFARHGGYANMPVFHGGGIYKAPPGQTQGPALLENNEGIFTREQMQAMGGPGHITVVVEDGAVDVNRIKVVADGQIVEHDRRRDQRMKAGVR